MEEPPPPLPGGRLKLHFSAVVAGVAELPGGAAGATDAAAPQPSFSAARDTSSKSARSATIRQLSIATNQPWVVNGKVGGVGVGGRGGG